MNISEATVGTRVRSLMNFSGVPKGTECVIDEDYGTGVMVAWDNPPGHSKLPAGYKRYEGEFGWRDGILRGGFGWRDGILRDGFDKETELHFLEVVM